MLPTLVAAAGNPEAKEQLLKGAKLGDRNYKVHLDGYNLLPALQDGAALPRREFIYWTDDVSVAALREDNWKITFLEQEVHGLHIWHQPFVELRASILNNLRMDLFELAPGIGIDYGHWYLEQMFVIAPRHCPRRPMAAELQRLSDGKARWPQQTAAFVVAALAAIAPCLAAPADPVS